MIHKISVIKSLVNRAFNLRSSDYLEDELKFVKYSLQNTLKHLGQSQINRQ